MRPRTFMRGRLLTTRVLSMVQCRFNEAPHFHAGKEWVRDPATGKLRRLQ